MKNWVFSVLMVSFLSAPFLAAENKNLETVASKMTGIFHATSLGSGGKVAHHRRVAGTPCRSEKGYRNSEMVPVGSRTGRDREELKDLLAENDYALQEINNENRGILFLGISTLLGTLGTWGLVVYLGLKGVAGGPLPFLYYLGGSLLLISIVIWIDWWDRQKEAKPYRESSSSARADLKDLEKNCDF